MSRAQRAKGRRGELRWFAFFEGFGLHPRRTDETGSAGHEHEVGADLELTDFSPPLRVQCKELRANCPSPRAMIEQGAHICAIHFTEGPLASRDILIVQADVLGELAAKVRETEGRTR